MADVTGPSKRVSWPAKRAPSKTAAEAELPAADVEHADRGVEVGRHGRVAQEPAQHFREDARKRGAKRPILDLPSVTPWPAPRPSSSAPPAPPRRRAGWGSAPAAGSGTRCTEETRGKTAAAKPRAGGAVRPLRLADVQAQRYERLKTEIGELDRILGGGLVPGSLVLIGGSPGIGKSTLTSMALGNLEGAGRRTLYVSGEESAAQIRLRAERLPGAALQVPVLAETDLDTVLGDVGGRGARGLRDRLGADAARVGPERRGGLGGAGARGRRPDHAAGQGARGSRSCSSAT